MRIRLLIDVDWKQDDVTKLAEIAMEQIPVHVTGTVEGAGLFLPGRLMGAQPVEIEATG